MINETVIADDGGREGKWVALSIAIILLIAMLSLPHHQAASQQQELASHQVSIDALEPTELAMIADLRLAHEEIRNIRQDSIELDGVDIWPEISELEELWLAPFVQDKSWQHKGRHQWLKVSAGVYQGIRQHEKGSASVVLNSILVEPDIWLKSDSKATPVNADQSRDVAALINAGWKQVVFSVQEENHLH